MPRRAPDEPLLVVAEGERHSGADGSEICRRLPPHAGNHLPPDNNGINKCRKEFASRNSGPDTKSKPCTQARKRRPRHKKLSGMSRPLFVVRVILHRTQDAQTRLRGTAASRDALTLLRQRPRITKTAGEPHQEKYLSSVAGLRQLPCTGLTRTGRREFEACGVEGSARQTPPRIFPGKMLTNNVKQA